MTHGTLHGYQYHRCRCDECRAAKSAYQREQRNRNRAPVRPSVPVAPLLELIAQTCGSELTNVEIGELCGVARETVQRWRHRGTIPDNVADRVAIALGYHPALIWGVDWYITSTLGSAA